MNAVRRSLSSWGRLSAPGHLVFSPAFRDQLPGILADGLAGGGGVLARGLGRSYGDSCLNGGGAVVLTQGLDRCLAFDRESGILRAEAGMSLAQLHRLTVPRGWLVAVTPGTKYVTLGGAVANDVHGKNGHVHGSFGRHVRRLGLRRSDGRLIECSLERETDLLRATIGGLGLTGLIEWVEIGLLPLTSSDMEVENIRFEHVDAFFELSADSADWPYTVSWVDCLSVGRTLGRGIFSRGRPAPAGPLVAAKGGITLSMPFTPPFSLVSPATVRLFNEAYFRRPGAGFRGRCHYDPFFYPLDGVLHWNRAYGPRGFYQYQCVLPPETARAGLREMLTLIADSREGSCLVVLKNFGDIPAAGLLSFAAPGTTLALDFPNRGARTLALLATLDQIVYTCGGRLYPAKDARMDGRMFRAGYPALGEFQQYVDPAFASDFQRRVMG